MDILKVWEKFARESLDRKKIPQLRNASGRKRAYPWIKVTGAPVKPATPLSNVAIYDGWVNPHNKKIAVAAVEASSSMTLRDLQHEMFAKMKENETPYPYIWWVCCISRVRERLLYEDAEGVNYVKLENTWRPAYPLLTAGCLAGAQCSDDYESVPLNGYFIVWDDEDVARQHANY